MTWSVISCGQSSVPVVSVEVVLLILDCSWFFTLHWAALSTTSPAAIMLRNSSFFVARCMDGSMNCLTAHLPY